MKIIEMYDKTKTYLVLSGAVATPEWVMANYPATTITPYAVETDESRLMLLGFSPLIAYKNNYSVPSGLSDEQAIQFIQDKMNEPQIQAEQEISRLSQVEADLYLLALLQGVDL